MTVRESVTVIVKAILNVTVTVDAKFIEICAQPKTHEAKSVCKGKKTGTHAYTPLVNLFMHGSLGGPPLSYELKCIRDRQKLKLLFLIQ